MTALGPQLAEALGGTWDEKCEWVRLSGHVIWESPIGNVRMQTDDGLHRFLLGSHRDGVEALAAKARQMGAA